MTCTSRTDRSSSRRRWIDEYCLRGSNGGSCPRHFSTDLGGGKANQILYPARGLAPASSRPFQHSCPEILTRIVSRIDYIFSVKRSIGSKGGGGQAYRKAQPSPLKADLRKLPPALPLDVSSGSTRSVVFTRDRVYPSIQPLAKLDDVCLKSLLPPSLSPVVPPEFRRRIPVPSQDPRVTLNKWDYSLEIIITRRVFFFLFGRGEIHCLRFSREFFIYINFAK